MGTTYGYARVSTQEQNLSRQLAALEQFGVDQLVTDKVSGKSFERPGYIGMRGKLVRGDVLVVMSIDRLGRNYNEILEEWRFLTKTIEADVVVLDMPLLDTRDNDERGITGVFIADFVLQLLSYVAQVERDHIRVRQRQGIDAARQKGLSLGRPRKRRPKKYDEVASRIACGKLSLRAAAKELQVSHSTVKRWLKEDALQVACDLADDDALLQAERGV